MAHEPGPPPPEPARFDPDRDVEVAVAKRGGDCSNPYVSLVQQDGRIVFMGCHPTMQAAWTDITRLVPP